MFFFNSCEGLGTLYDAFSGQELPGLLPQNVEEEKKD